MPLSPRSCLMTVHDTQAHPRRTPYNDLADWTSVSVIDPRTIQSPVPGIRTTPQRRQWEADDLRALCYQCR
jgi:hypothetical protein